MAQFITLPPDWLQKQIEETRREVALWPPEWRGLTINGEYVLETTYVDGKIVKQIIVGENKPE